MGAGCCTTGTSEKETLLLTLEWGSGWASTMAKDLMVLRECIRNICSYGCCYRNLSNNHDGETVNELSAKLDSIKVLLSGLVKNLDCSYRDEDEDVLSNLLNSFDNAKKQCKGELPIAVNRMISVNVALKSTIGESHRLIAHQIIVASTAPAVPGPQGQKPAPKPVPMMTDIVDGFSIAMQK